MSQILLTMLGALVFEIPCFKCLLIPTKEANPLQCDPVTCKQLNEWLHNEMEKDEKLEEKSTTNLGEYD